MNKRYADFTRIALALVAAGVAHAQSLVVTPNPINLYAQSGMSFSASQTVTVKSSDNTTVLPFTVYPGNAWINPVSGTPAGGWVTPATFSVSVNPSLLPSGSTTGVFAGSLIFNGPQFLTVPLNVTVSTIGISTNSISLGSYQAGSTVYPPDVSPLTLSGDTANLRITQGAGDNWYTYQAFGTPPSQIKVSFNPSVAASLSPGTLTGTLTLTPQGANPVPVAIGVSLSVTQSPQVTVKPVSLVFNWQRGGTNQTTQFLTLTSNATQAINVNLSAPGIGWVTLPSNPTAIPANGSVQVPIQVLQAAGDAQTIGANNGLIQITIPGGGALFPNGTTTWNESIQLNVSNAPMLFVPAASLSLSFTNQFGSATVSPTSIAVIPTSSGVAMTYTVSPATASWLTIAPPSTTSLSTSGGQFAVSANPAGLAPATYTSTIYVIPTANGSGQSPITINVSLTVTFPNVLQTSVPTNPLVCGGGPCLVFQYQAGQSTPASQTVNLSSTTGAPLNYTVTPPAAASWVQVSGPLTGTTDNTSFTVSINPSGLTASPADATIAIAATDPTTAAAVNTVSIAVKLYFSSAPQLVVSATQTGVTPLAPLQLSTWPNSAKYPGNDQLPVSVYLSSTLPSTGELTNVAVQHAVGSQSTFGDWLLVNNPGSGTPASFTIGAVRDASRMPLGTYYGAVSITASGPPSGTAVADSPFSIPVQFVVNAAKGSVSYTAAADGSLSFTQTKGGPPPASQLVQVATDTGSLPFDPVVNTGLYNWLTVGPVSGPTPGSFSVSVDGSSLTVGTWRGAIYVNIPNAAGSPIRIPVTLTVNAGAICAGSCSSAQGPLSFTQVMGAAAPPAQTVAIASTPSSLAYTIGTAVTTPAGGTWLAASIASGGGSTPGTVSVSVNVGSLAAGTYAGSVTVTSPGATGSPISIPVTFTVQQATISSPTTQLQFSQLAGGAAPPAQPIPVTSTPSGVPFTVSTSSGASWLTATAGSSGTTGTTPGTVSVSVNSGSLAPGQYTGVVTITSASAIGSPISVNVTLTVVAPAVLTVSQSTLAFSTTVGQTTTPQTIQLTSSFTTAFIATVAFPDHGTWLSVSPASGTVGASPVTLTVSANTQNLAAGSYSGSVIVSSTSFLNPVTIAVGLTVTAVPTPVITAVENAASNQITGVSPGENIVIYGTGLGPQDLVKVTELTSAGKFPTTLANTQVLFDGIPAPIYYASAKQTSVFVPYGVGGRAATNIQVIYLNVQSAAVAYNVLPAVPGIYTLNFSGAGPGAILNPDGITVNGPNAPVAKGAAVAIFMTGEGATTPAGTDGAIAGTPGYPLAKPILGPVTATVAGLPATIQYAGSAPGGIYGFTQVNIAIPANAPSGAQPVVISFGSYSTQPGVTVAVQ